MSVRVIPKERISEALDREAGLTGADVLRQRQQYGYNDVLVEAPARWRDILLKLARDPMIWFLLGVSILFAVLGEWLEAAILFSALVPLLAMDAYLHQRTQASTAGLASRLASYATVLRDGKPETIEAREVVPSDIILVGPGDMFPADGLLLSCTDAQVDESSLTGEAFPVRKQPIAPATSLPGTAEDQHWVFAGTRLLTGSACMLVLSTGGATLYGEIARLAVLGNEAATPLQKAVGRTVSVLLVAAVGLCLLLAGVRLLQGYGVLDAFLSAVVLAIAALPEEFPVVLTFFLGVGVYRLAKQQALVRKAVVVENIGRVSCICTDKTGTLTEGKLILSHTSPAPGCAVAELVQWAALACRSDSGDPLDAAILDANSAPVTGFEAIATFPFTEDRKREVCLYRRDDGTGLAAMKGAPEEVFSRCLLSPGDLRQWQGRVEQFAEAGHKVIAVATQSFPQSVAPDTEPEQSFALAGLLALEDPIRDGVQSAVAACYQAGIRVIMITGDHPATAVAIAREAGICDASALVLAGADIDRKLDLETAEGWGEVQVFARATPSQKLRLVQALQAAGHVVAVTGDGVNDVPALQAADIGIAMGARGTQSAREIASIVLLDDNFGTIVRAIAEGRQLFSNLRLSFAYLVIIHIPFVLTAALIPLMGNPLLYLPIHIVWLELIIHPTALLVFQDLPGTGPLARAEGNQDHARIFSGHDWFFLCLPGVLLAVAVTLSFEWILRQGGSVEHARTIAFSILVFGSMAVMAALSGLKSGAPKVIAIAGISSLIIIVEVSAIASVVHLVPLSLANWGAVFTLAGLVGAVVHWMRQRLFG